MIQRFKLHLLLLAALTTFWAGTSQAAFVEYTNVVQGPTQAIDVSLAVNRFDPALGSLTGATFTLTGTVDSVLTVSSGSTASTVTWQKLDFTQYGPEYRYFIDISGPSSMTAANAWAGEVAYKAPVAAGQPATFSAPTLLASLEATFSGLDLNPFIGAGSLEFLLNANSFDSVSVTGGRPFSMATAYEGTITVVYDYTPVPIPGAAWLLGSGLIGLAGLRRRLRQG